LVAIRADAESPDWDLGREEELVLGGGLRPTLPSALSAFRVAITPPPVVIVLVTSLGQS
jgi:hypothetical protein